MQASQVTIPMKHTGTVATRRVETLVRNHAGLTSNNTNEAHTNPLQTVVKSHASHIASICCFVCGGQNHKSRDCATSGGLH